MFKRNGIPSIEAMLESIEGLNADEGVKGVIARFLNDDIMSATGIMIISTHGKNVDINGSKFSETEATWALEKAKYQILNKGLSFND